MSPRAPASRLARHASPIAAAACLAGCAGFFETAFAPEGASVQLEGLGRERTLLTADLPYAAYADQPAQESVYLSEEPLDDLLSGALRDGQLLHVQLLWIPKPGRTPVDASATNIVIRYVVIADGQVGVYGGGGFAWPRGKLGKTDLSMVIKGSSVSLLAKTDGFVDLLSPAELTGTIIAGLAPDEVARYRRGLSQLVTDALGHTRWVRAEDGAALSADQVVALMRAEPSAVGPTH